MTTDHTWLVTLISRSFSPNQLLDLCSDLHVEAEDFTNPPADFPRQLVAELARQQRLPELIARCAQLRPLLNWRPESVARRRLPFAQNPPSCHPNPQGEVGV